MAQIVLKFQISAPDNVASYIRQALQRDGKPHMSEEITTVLADGLLDWLIGGASDDDYEALLEWDSAESIAFEGID